MNIWSESKLKKKKIKLLVFYISLKNNLVEYSIQINMFLLSDKSIVNNNYNNNLKLSLLIYEFI